jgi:hypothetical protein
MIRRRKLSTDEQRRKALDDIGGQPLEGSGFEEETPEEGFSGSAVAVAESAEMLGLSPRPRNKPAGEGI